jgi:hypothetical protein
MFRGIGWGNSDEFPHPMHELVNAGITQRTQSFQDKLPDELEQYFQHIASLAGKGARSTQAS